MNMPPKALRAGPPFSPIAAATATNTATLAQRITFARASLPVQTPISSADMANTSSTNSGRKVEKSA